MKRPITDELEKWVVDQHGFMAKPAADHAIVALGDCREQVAKLRNDSYKIAIYRKDVISGSDRIAVAKRPADAIRRIAQHNLHAVVVLLEPAEKREP